METCSSTCKIHIYYGDGKGKTTAAIGQCIRAAGHGYQVLIYQFMKNNTSNERKILEQLSDITCIQGRDQVKFSFNMTEAERTEAAGYYSARFSEIADRAAAYQVLLLDEVICAVQAGFIKEEQLITFLHNKPEQLEVILTGNTPSDKLIACADYVTCMKKVKHPYDQGQKAREGIER